MSDAIADLYITLSMVDTAALTSMTEFGAAGESMVATLTTALTELQVRLAALGGEFTGLAAGVAEAGAAAGTSSAEVAGLSAEFTAAGRSAATMGGEVDASLAAMQSQIAAADASLAAMAAETSALQEKMAVDNAALAASTKEAAVANAALGDAMGTTQTKAAAANTTMGVSNNTLLAVGAAAIGVAYEASKMAGDFQAAITRLETSAGEVHQNLQLVGDGILAMAGDVGYSADELAKAMYMVESSGQHGAAGLTTLKAAAQGAKAENAELTTVAEAVTSAMVDYHLKAEDAATVTSKLVQATAQGKTTFEDLSRSMSSVLPIASANHVSLNDILGDLASMTVHGMSAQQATQNLADTIRQLAQPSAASSKELAALGMNATEVQKSLGTNGLAGTINEISQRIQSQMGPDGMVVVNLTNALKGLAPPVQELGKRVLDGTMSLKDFSMAAKDLDVVSAKQAMSFSTLVGSMHGIGTEAKSGAEVYQTYSGALRKALGDSTAMNVALMISGENTEITTNDIRAISAATADASNNVKGWTEIQGTFNQKIASAKDAFGALMISIGEKLLPVLTVAADKFATVATWMAQHQTVAMALATVIGGALVLAFLALTYAAAKWVATSIAGMAADAGRTAVWVAEKITGFTAVAVASEGSALATAAAWVAANFAMIAATGGIILIVGLLAGIAYEVITHWQGVKNFFIGLWNGIKQAWDDFWGGFENPFAKVAKSVSSFEKFFLDLGATVRRVFDTIKDVITGGPAEWGRLLGMGVGLLVRAAVNLGIGIYHGFITGIKALNDFCLNLPIWITNFFVGAGKFLWGVGGDIMHGLWEGMKAAWHGGFAFIKAIPGALLDFFTGAPGFLYDVGKAILKGLWDGFTSLLGWVFNGIGDFIMGFIHGFEQGFEVSSPSRVMMRIGGDIIRGLWDGVVNMWNSFWGWVSGIPGWVIGFFAGAPTWLVSAGYNIVVGLWNGISSGWSWLTNNVASLASSLLATAKGALGISSPSKAFADQVGAWIGPGIAQGITANGHLAMQAAKQLANGVTQAATGNFTAQGSGLDRAGAVLTRGGAGGTTLNVNVAGHVWAVQDLVTELQSQLLRHGIRNNTPGINYNFG